MPALIASGTDFESDLLAVEEQRALVPAAVGAAEDAAGELGAAGAHQPGDTDDLPAAHLRLTSLTTGAAVVRGVHDGPVADLEQHVADVGRVVGEAVLEVAADHAADDPVLVDVSARTSRVSMVRPSRMIVIASATCSISLSLWEIMIEVMPLPCSPWSRSSRLVESSSLSAAVGSSRISSLTFLVSALAISTSCCLPMPRCLTGVRGFSRSRRGAAARWRAGWPRPS